MDILTAHFAGAVASPDEEHHTDSSLSPEQILSLLRQARQLPGVTVARLELLHRVLEDGFSPDAYSIPEIMEITGHGRTQAVSDKHWIRTCGLVPICRPRMSLQVNVSPLSEDEVPAALPAVDSLDSAEAPEVPVQPSEPCMCTSPVKDISLIEDQNLHGSLERTALRKLQDIGWGRLGEYLISRWDDHAHAYIDRHGAERVLYAIEYAEKEGCRRGEEFGPGWITGCLRNPEFNPPEGWEPTLVGEDIEKILADPAYREAQYEMIDRQIRPFERLLGYLPDEADRMRRKWAGHHWLEECPIWRLEAYRDWLWGQVESLVKVATLRR